MTPLLAALLLALAPPAAAPGPPPASPPSKHIAKVMAHGDGASPETAYRVSRIRDEYEIVRALGLEVASQSLVARKKRPFDVLTVVDPKDGRRLELWFDIGKFYPAF